MSLYENNIYLNKEHFKKHHVQKYRKERLKDFVQLYNILKEHLVPTEKAKINEKLLEKYVDLYKPENRELIIKLLDKIENVSFKKFHQELLNQTERFNKYIELNKIKKYIFVVGVSNTIGACCTDFTISKSNLWVFMLMYPHLKLKPYDILINLNTALRLYKNIIDDVLIVDDCSYSGNQLIEEVIKKGTTEFLYDDKKTFIVNEEMKNTMYKSVQDKLMTIHIVLPYMSKISNDKINNLELETGFNIIKYNSYIINPISYILDRQSLKRLNNLYSQFYGEYYSINNLIPVFFEHKIADMISTFDLILIKGQVLDDPDKKQVFINSCIYDKNNPLKQEFNPRSKNFIEKKLYCPRPPYLDFPKILRNKLKK